MSERINQATVTLGPSSEQERLRIARALTLGTMILDRFNVAILCNACGYRRVVDPQPLYDLCRVKAWGMHVDQLMNKFRCSRCAEKRATLKATVEACTGPPIGPTTQEEFRRMVRRHR